MSSLCFRASKSLHSHSNSHTKQTCRSFHHLYQYVTLVLLLLLARTLFSITSFQAGWTALHSFGELIPPLDDRPAIGQEIWGAKYHPMSRINTYKSLETEFDFWKCLYLAGRGKIWHPAFKGMLQKGSVFFPFQGRLLEAGKEKNICSACGFSCWFGRLWLPVLLLHQNFSTLQELGWQCNSL